MEHSGERRIPLAEPRGGHQTRRATTSVGLLLAAAVVVIVVVVVVAGLGGPSRPTLSSFYGVNLQGLVLSSPEIVDPHLQRIAAAGLGTVRTDSSWDVVEPQPPVAGVHAYQWALLDRFVSGLARAHLSWEPVIDYSTSWAAAIPGHFLGPPATDGDYSHFAAALVARYGPKGTFWRAHAGLSSMPVTSVEIWNEENLPGFWNNAPDPARYALLYTHARDAIRAVAPGVQVWFGGLAPIDPAGYLRRAFAAAPALRSAVDAVALHPYAASAQAAEQVVVDTRAALDGLTDHKVPLELTELGFSPSDQGNLSGPARADSLAAFAKWAYTSGCAIGSLFVFTWTDPPAATGGGGYGIAGADAKLDPAGRAYAAAVVASRELSVLRQHELPSPTCAVGTPTQSG